MLSFVSCRYLIQTDSGTRTVDVYEGFVPYVRLMLSPQEEETFLPSSSSSDQLYESIKRRLDLILAFTQLRTHLSPLHPQPPRCSVLTQSTI